MEKDGEIDYRNYTRQELIDARGVIDSRHYPINLENLARALAALPPAVVAPATSQTLSTPAHQETAVQSALGVNGGAPMNQLDVTWERALQIWWAFAWRGLLIVLLPSTILGAVIGIVFTLNKIPVEENLWVIRGVGVVIGLPLGLWLIKVVFSTPFSGFRIALVAIDAQQITPADRPLAAKLPMDGG